jgi:energy-coupling factor transporter transmembrane protein EcfT
VRVEWHTVWGSARGPLTRLAPPIRLVCAACAFAACLLAPAASGEGVAVVALVVLLWWLLCRPPLALARGAALLGLALFLPYLALAPLIRAEAPGGGWSGAFAAPWSVALRGWSTMQIGIASAATLSPVALRQALDRLPVPGVVAAVLLQIIHQTATLMAETRRIAAALVVRAAAAGARSRLRVLSSLPRVWLPRVAARAERVAAAMELRGYRGEAVPPTAAPALSAPDLIATALAVAGLAAVIALRQLGER